MTNKRQLFTMPATNTFVDVSELSADDQQYQAEIQRISKAIETLEQKLDALYKECAHSTFYEVDTHVYTYRHCAICNKLVATI